MNQGGGAAPTGCYKCGRPGHWSRDCPLEIHNNDNQDLPPDSNNNPNTWSKPPLAAQKPKQKLSKRTRPKLTPDLLLSDKGIGHILRYFPRALKYRGRGHEVDDLGHLLSLYADWHSRLLPYYSFEQFIDKVERVGSMKRVKVCLRDLREKVDRGVDPTKLQEPQAEQDSIDGQDAHAPDGVDMPSTFPENNMQTEDENILQEDMPQSVWEEATEEPSQPVRIIDTERREEEVNETSGNSNKIVMSEEQKARMEANRLRALEKAAARSRSSRAS